MFGRWRHAANGQIGETTGRWENPSKTLLFVAIIISHADHAIAIIITGQRGQWPLHAAAAPLSP